MKPKDERMESRNLRIAFRLFLVVITDDQAILSSRSTMMRAIMGCLAMLLILVKLSSPFLHTHVTDLAAPGHSLGISHCDSCDYEATSGVEPSILLTAPIVQTGNQLKECSEISVIPAFPYSCTDSRGSPVTL